MLLKYTPARGRSVHSRSRAACFESLERRVMLSVSVGANVNISRATTNQTEGAIAVDPTNPQHLFALSNLETGTGLFGAVSTDGGVTWSTRTMATGSDGLTGACCDPSVSWDAFGNLFLV